MQGLDPLKNVEQFYCQTVVFFNRVKPLEIRPTVACIKPSQQMSEGTFPGILANSGVAAWLGDAQSNCRSRSCPRHIVVMQK